MFRELEKKTTLLPFGGTQLWLRFDNAAFLIIEKSGFNPFDIRVINTDGKAARVFLNAGLARCFEQLSITVAQNYDPASTDPISGVGVATAMSYSTTEKRIGTWANNKPLYRRTWSGAVNAGASGNIFNLGTNKRIVSLHGAFFSVANNSLSIPWSGGSNNNEQFNVYYSASTGYIISVVVGLGTTSQTLQTELIIEYIKTTD